MTGGTGEEIAREEAGGLGLAVAENLGLSPGAGTSLKVLKGKRPS